MYSPRTKQRHDSHKKGAKGVKLVKEAFPEDWVVRELTPDYGLDLHVEVFQADNHDPRSSNTLGEHFYVQVKAEDRLTRTKAIVRERPNVAKHDPNPKQGMSTEIDVFKFSLDTRTLLTVEAMGAAVPVLLCLVDLSTDTVYYVCLNDYITKVLLPSKPEYEKQRTVTIRVPAWNVLDKDDVSFSYLRLLARRSKYYAAFNTLAYQHHELEFARMAHPIRSDFATPERARPSRQFLATARVFLRSARRLPVWQPTTPGHWAPLRDVREALESAEKRMPLDDEWMSADEVESWERHLVFAFDRAASLGRMYEELVREWRLPTALAAPAERPEI